MKSLNPPTQIIQFNKIVYRFELESKTIRQITGKSVTFDDWLKVNKINLKEEIKKPLNILKYYKSFSKCNRVKNRV